MTRKLTLNEFISRTKKIHGEKYSYSQISEIKGSQIKIKIYCKACQKYFEQTPNGHLSGRGCNKCAIKLRAQMLSSGIKDFIKKAKKIHGNKYKYNQAKYINKYTPIKIYCKKCKSYFLQTPASHLKGCGCKKCGLQLQANHRRLTLAQFIQKAQAIHKNDYDYSKVIYKTKHTKVQIYCRKCKNFFEQEPNVHLKGCGCPYCNFSKGEKRIKEWLEDKNIVYEPQKRFKECKDKHLLPFDFYLPDYDICIEFQGKQHYDLSSYLFRAKSIEIAKQNFKILQYHDQLKRDFCKRNAIKLIEIKYTDNISEILNKSIYYIQ